MAEIASVSLARPLAEIADRLGRSFAEFGFAIVRDHGIAQGLIDDAYGLARRFFDLPEEVKRAYFIAGGGGARGYTPFGTEVARDAKVHDLKEFWHIGRTLPAGHPFAEKMPNNVWPEELPGFQQTFEALFAEFDRAGGAILRALALYLKLDPAFFDDATASGNSVMRLLHYPPLPEAVPPGAVRAAPHGDINAITLLLGAEEAGLELLDQRGNWRPVSPPEGALAVNIGDMLERLTNNRLRSTSHRVVNPLTDAARRSRYSMPFFHHFRPDFLIDPPAQFVTEHECATLPEPITADEFLDIRLREIGLK